MVSDGEGGLLYNRPPRIISPAGPATVRYPGSAPVRTGVNFPLMASVAPVILGVAMAVLFHNPQWLLFTLLSPVMAISNFVSQRRSGTRSFRDRSRAHVRAVEAADADLDSVLRWEMTARRASTPDAATLAAVALGPQRRLWERRRTDPDFLRLRIGQADQPADVTVEGRSGESAGPGGPGSGGAPDGEHPLLAGPRPRRPGRRRRSRHRRRPAAVRVPGPGSAGTGGHPARPRRAGRDRAQRIAPARGVGLGPLAAPRPGPGGTDGGAHRQHRRRGDPVGRRPGDPRRRAALAGPSFDGGWGRARSAPGRSSGGARRGLPAGRAARRSPRPCAMAPPWG